MRGRSTYVISVMRAEAPASEPLHPASDGQADGDDGADKHADRDQLANVAEGAVAHCLHSVAAMGLVKRAFPPSSRMQIAREHHLAGTIRQTPAHHQVADMARRCQFQIP